MLNNGSKSGVLELQNDRFRVSFTRTTGKSRQLPVRVWNTATRGPIHARDVSELAPVIKLTVGGRRGSEVDGLVELLDNKVLDPRLLKKVA